jgi:Uma2 family endonuclease
MIDFGMIKDVEKTEIIGGELVKKIPIGKIHATTVKKLAELLRDALLERRDDFYRGKQPFAEDVLMLIEVSDSTLDYDRNRKIPLYAKAGIPEVWLVNLQNSNIEIHSQPREFSYSVVQVLRSGETLKSNVLPNLTLNVDDILE